MEKWYVYIAKARTGRYYVGISKDVETRVMRHNSSRGSKFCVNQGPFTLAYKSLAFESKSEAHKRELQIKRWSQVKKEKLINGEWH